MEGRDFGTDQKLRWLLLDIEESVVRLSRFILILDEKENPEAKQLMESTERIWLAVREEGQKIKDGFK